MSSCASCHTLTGSEEGKKVKLEQSMHQVDATSSCIGCHTEAQQDPKCAGCHDSMARHDRKDEKTCVACHMSPPAGYNPDSSDVEKQAAATQLLESRQAIMGTYSDADIPEKVIIKELVDKYKPVELPHRKIVNTLVNNIKDNKIARYFHTDEGTLCQGCHHNSPPAKKPPLCGSCHGKPFDERNPFKPGLMGAYHQQCMECHQTMGIAKPPSQDCTACHLEQRKF